jgi:hypothetical protein
MAVQLGTTPSGKKVGHSYFQYSNKKTGESRISRAGPSRKYRGGAIGALLNRKQLNTYLHAEDTPAEESRDPGDLEAQEIYSVTIDSDMSSVQETISEFNEEVNSAKIPYRPRDPSSNNYSSDAFKKTTGIEPSNDSDLALPGFDKEVPIEADKEPVEKK